MKTKDYKKNLNFRSLSFIAVLTIAFLVTACQNEEETSYEEPQIEAQLDIAATLEKINETPEFFDTVYEGELEVDQEETLKSGKRSYYRPTFRNLVYALFKTNLFWTVVRNELTVFAPSDRAFKAFLKENGYKNIRQVPKETLKAVLLYHVVEGKVRSTDLSNGYVPTLNGAAVMVALSSGVMINDANVKYADIRALNGIIHVIDKVLFPPTQNIVEIAQSMPDNFSILVDVVVAAGLAETLSSEGDYTVFAPTNDAFVSLLGELGLADLNALVGAIGIEGVKKVLLYHVVDGRVYSSDLPMGPLTVPTLNGGTFEIDVTIPGITDFNGRQAGLIPSLLNVQATNGVIHVIDKVILPEL
jgi:transforming growth factor-beta-induced protein